MTAADPNISGQPFFETLPAREGTHHGGDARDWAKQYDEDPAIARRRILAATYTVAELLRNGVTTFMDFGAQLPTQEALREEVDRLGIRAYLGPSFRSLNWVGDRNGRIKRVWDEDAGRRDLEIATEFITKYDGASDGRLRGLLIPFTSESVTPELLRATRKKADELKVPIAVHAAYNILEFYQIVTEQGLTPIELLDSVGLLARDVVIGHGNFLAESRGMNYAAGRDLELMAKGGVTISHCPINLARRGRYLETWAAYKKAGVNLALGSDTYPRDMIMNMRIASYVGKIMSGSYFAATAAEVFEAATLAPTRALGRDDLGRLAVRRQGGYHHHRPKRRRYATLRSGTGSDKEPGPSSASGATWRPSSSMASRAWTRARSKASRWPRYASSGRTPRRSCGPDGKIGTWPGEPRSKRAPGPFPWSARPANVPARLPELLARAGERSRTAAAPSRRRSGG